MHAQGRAGTHTHSRVRSQDESRARFSGRRRDRVEIHNDQGTRLGLRQHMVSGWVPGRPRHESHNPATPNAWLSAAKCSQSPWGVSYSRCATAACWSCHIDRPCGDNILLPPRSAPSTAWHTLPMALQTRWLPLADRPICDTFPRT
jgi:hypothetical protein